MLLLILFHRYVPMAGTKNACALTIFTCVGIVSDTFIESIKITLCQNKLTMAKRAVAIYVAIMRWGFHNIVGFLYPLRRLPASFLAY
jgi:hypothetical protein